MRFLLGCMALFVFLNVSYAETLSDLQNTPTTGKNSIDYTVIKPQYLPEFDSKGEKSYEAAQSVIYKTINLILYTAGVIAVLVLILAGFIYTMNAGMEDLQTKAKNAIIYTIAGLIAIFLAYAVIENTVRYLYQEEEPQPYEELPTLEQKDVVEIQKTAPTQSDAQK